MPSSPTGLHRPVSLLNHTPALALAVLLTGLVATPRALAHGGQIEVAGGARGPVQLSAAQQLAIALQVVAAGPHAMSTVLNVNGEIQLLPDQQSGASLRISGQITALYANVGDRVRAGQPLARVQARLAGDPPPSVTVTAPRTGLIDERSVVVGQAVEPNTQLFHISDRSEVIVLGKVYEEDLGKVKLGQQARVHVLAYPERIFVGRVTVIEPNLDPLSRTVKTWIRLANPDGLLKPNMFARSSLVLSQNEAALVVPSNAILEANGERFVFVREGGKFDRVEVTLGARDDQFSEITDGLIPGDEVVTQGVRQVYTMWLTGSQTKAKK